MKNYNLITRLLIQAVKQEVLKDLQNENLGQSLVADDDDLPMTSKEICSHFKISPSTLERYVRQGLKFSSTKKNAKRLFTKRQFNHFINSKKSKL